MSIRIFKQIYFRLPVILKLLITILMLMLLFGMVIHFVEPQQFPTIFDGIWWAFVTAATVGYGDYVPLSVAGKLIAILLILTGGGLIAFYITSLSAATIQHERDLEGGRLAFKGSNHLILVGWNERTRQLIKIITKTTPDLRIVLIDRTLQHVAFQNYPVHFIQGDATEDETLVKANVELAERVLITADISKRERQADNYTILTTVAIRGNNKEIPIVAEVLSKVQIENALRAGATTIIRSNDFMSALFYHELSHIKAATPFEDILQILNSQQFHHSKLPEDLDNKPFIYISKLHSKKQHLLLGLIRNKTYHLNPPAEFLVKEGDILLSLVNWQN
ncbi:potassium channel family protein [Virgibacillus sp. C22-A2]|uniref:Potassium channel family protein n=1 Tax=Virgibacillus tibetensis TaxID=3042313 RepID=A0ABU6KHV9_9BACI|nr:potassium channel family protein [Virgibacillus sp. C22-A2]